MNSRARSRMAKKKLKHLSDGQIRQVAAQFRALSQPLRLHLINELMDGELNVSQLVKNTGANQSNVSKHLGEMHKAKLLDRRRDGLNIYYSIADARVFRLCELMCSKPERALKNGALDGNAEL